MNSYYKINYTALLKSQSFHEATREELRILLAIAAKGGEIDTSLAESADVSAARCASALTLWETEGILTRGNREGADDTRAVIIDEFHQSTDSIDFDEQMSEEVASSIRNGGLQDLINECTVLMDRATLNTQEIKKITSLVTQYALKEDFILTLAAHLREKGVLTVRRLFDKSVKLIEKGIEDTDRLEKYIQDCESNTDTDWELRHLLGIYNRTLTKKQKHYFKRWTEELGYSTAIIGEAYDVTVDTKGTASLPYMDAILTKWWESGCRTVEECLAKQEAERLAKNAEYKAKSSSSKKQTEAETPKYADFDTEDALMRALQRSYGEDSK